MENPNAPEKQSVLILKDSYQNSTLDYFTAIFQTVHVVDPRHYQETDTLTALLDAGSVDLILFFYHQDNISDELIELLNREREAVANRHVATACFLHITHFPGSFSASARPVHGLRCPGGSERRLPCRR